VTITFAPELLASEVASQIAAHGEYGGIVPEIASRQTICYTRRAYLDRTCKRG